MLSDISGTANPGQTLPIRTATLLLVAVDNRGELPPAVGLNELYREGRRTAEVRTIVAIASRAETVAFCLSQLISHSATHPSACVLPQ